VGEEEKRQDQVLKEDEGKTERQVSPRSLLAGQLPLAPQSETRHPECGKVYRRI